MSDLDVVYRAQRLRLRNTTLAAANALWARDHGDRNTFLARILPLVGAGQRATVSLVDAYMAAKVKQALGDGTVKGLNPGDYTIEKLRGLDPNDVYARPFGLMWHEVGNGASLEGAAGAAAGYVGKLAATDLQMAQTYSARDWMSGDERVAGYERNTAGDCCDFCEAAADDLYHSDDLMPIHENCSCDVQPVFDTGGQDYHSGTDAGDSEIGPRLP